jgi:putative tryptophan/tyrosine transport system substrate-binding protein
MKRRVLLAATAAASLSPATVRAQQKKLPRVGILTPAASDQTAVFAALRKGFADLGYIDGETMVLDYRFAKGDSEALPKLARELVDAGVDVIMTEGPALFAAARATRTIPIVSAAAGDPVVFGLAASLSHPGGNVTGFSIRPAELMGKRLELLKYAFPRVTRVAALTNLKSPSQTESLRRAQQAAGELHLELTTVEADNPDSVRALTPASFAGADGLITVPDAMLWNQRRVIVSLAAAARLPAIYPEREFADDGGLIAYGPNIPDHFRRAAGYVVRILKGAKAGDLPIEESEKFDFVVNMRTARTLGLQPAADFLSGANEVIE